MYSMVHSNKLEEEEAMNYSIVQFYFLIFI